VAISKRKPVDPEEIRRTVDQVVRAMGVVPRTSPSAQGKLCYTLNEFMYATGYSRNKLYQAIEKGTLRTFKDGKRRRVTAEAAQAFIAAQEKAGSE
jgi:excisionase family DNA binding protein